LGKFDQRREEFDEPGAAFTLVLLLGLAKERGFYAKAEECGLKALDIHRRLGDKQNEKEVEEKLRAA
jgi:hypothetical protein